MTKAFWEYAALFAVGLILGSVFFGGLWLTVRQLPHTRHPAVLFLASMVLRMAVVLGGIWYFAATDPVAICCCLAGFIAARLLTTHSRMISGQPCEQERAR